MTLETPLWLQPGGGDPAIQYSAGADRTVADALVYIAGVSWRDDLAVVQRAAGANFSVDIGTGHCIVPGTSLSYQGKYFCRNSAVVNLAITGAPGSSTRYDLVYAQVRDKPSDGGTSYDWKLDKITGTLGAGVPTLAGAGIANAIALAEIGPIVPGTASITTSLIKDVRVRARAVDDPLHVLSVAEVGSHAATGTTRVTVIPAQTFKMTGDPTHSKYLFTVYGQILTGTTGGELGRLILNIDSTEVARCQWSNPAAGGAGEVTANIPEFPLQIGAGNHTVQVDMIRVSGGTQVNSTSVGLLVKKALAI